MESENQGNYKSIAMAKVPLGFVASLVQELIFFISFLTALQFECHSQHCGAAAEGVVVDVGVDAVEEGVGVAALVQEIGEFQAEDALLPFVLRGGVEEGHIFIQCGDKFPT